MTLNFNSKIEFSAGQETRAIFDSDSTDNKFNPENPTKTKITFNKKIIEIEQYKISKLKNRKSVYKICNWRKQFEEF